MSIQAPVSEPIPIMEMNTTPLIDVLLVLLVMLIITIPIQSHAVTQNPPGGWPAPMSQPTSNTLEITRAGTLLSDGQPITRDGFKNDLQLTPQMPRIPELQLRPDP